MIWPEKEESFLLFPHPSPLFLYHPSDQSAGSLIAASATGKENEALVVVRQRPPGSGGLAGRYFPLPCRLLLLCVLCYLLINAPFSRFASVQGVIWSLYGWCLVFSLFVRLCRVILQRPIEASLILECVVSIYPDDFILRLCFGVSFNVLTLFLVEFLPYG